MAKKNQPVKFDVSESALNRLKKLSTNDLVHTVQVAEVAYIVGGMAAKELREQKRWEDEGFSSWAAFCLDVIGHTKQHVNRRILAAEAAGQAERISSTPLAETAALALSKVPKRSRIKLLRGIDNPTEQNIREAANKLALERKKRAYKRNSAKKPNSVSDVATVLHGCCLECLPDIVDASVRLILTDPPYLLGKQKTKKWSGFNGYHRAELPTWDGLSQDEFLQQAGQWLNESKRILTADGSIFIFTSWSQLSFLGSAAQEAGLFPRAALIWRKTNPTPVPTKTFIPSVEYILYCTAGKRRVWNEPKGILDVLECPQVSPHESVGVQVAQKPVKLLRQIIELTSETGDTVLDMFAGTGSTGVAAIESGRKAILIEKNKKMIPVIENRLADVIEK